MAITILMPAEVAHIIETLNRAGYDAFIVGGCVRDSLMGKEPNDWDIATSAQPDQSKLLFEKTIDTGIQHGTITILINKTPYEVTTFRIDGAYLDNRRPEAVYFTTSITEDLSRRDFTMNAMAYHPRTGLVDPFGGAQSIENQIIMTVGDPKARFEEDALRMLRAIRFSAQLGFQIDQDTLAGIKNCSSLIQSISMERIRDELDKVLLSDNPMGLLLADDTGLLDYILPEFALSLRTPQHSPYHIYNVGLHSLHAVSYVEKNRVLRWTALLHDVGKAYVKTTDEKGIDHFYGHPTVSAKHTNEILKRLRFDSKSIDSIHQLVTYHDRIITATGKSVRKAVNAVGQELFLDLLKIKEADTRAQNPKYLDERLKLLAAIKSLYQTILDENQCIHLKDLAINGNDLIEMGFKKDKMIGKTLESLLDSVLEHPEWNVREKLLEEAKKAMIR